MIRKTLPELIRARELLDFEIANYDNKTFWTQILNKMSIGTNRFEFSETRDFIYIDILGHYAIYSWYLPKGAFTIGMYNNKLRITVYKNQTSIDSRND